MNTGTRASAFRVEKQADLIGGPQALGQVGDYKLQNGKVAVIVQDTGFSRGFGVYGGSIIDADLQRPGASGDAQGGHGNDRFAEMFPVFFLQAARPTKIEVTNDGSDGQPARVLVTAQGGPFLTQANLLNSLVFNDSLTFYVEYSLGKDDQFIKITSSIENVGVIPRNLVANLPGLSLPVPFGSVALFGGTNKVFIPGPAGYDLRYKLPEMTALSPKKAPALPGIVSDLIASSGEGVSYGVFAEPSEFNFAYNNRDQYTDANPGSIEIPFFFSSFIGYYFSIGPPSLAPKTKFSFSQYFAIAKGDVAGIRDVFHQVRGIPTGTFAGRVRNGQTLKGEPGISVLVYRDNGDYFSQHTTDADGDFQGTMPAGDYSYRIVSNSHTPSAAVAFSITEGQRTSVEPFTEAPALLNVEVSDDSGRRVPAKVMLIGTHDYMGPNPEPRQFLFDLAQGERRRQVDQTPDTEDPSTRRFVEAQFWTANGSVGEQVRPGHYTVMVERGPEYEVESMEADLVSGQLTRLSARLRHVVDSKGYVSGDFHLHSANSIDSGEKVGNRVIGCAAEGLDFAVATDHNFITDYSPYIVQHHLQEFLAPVVGLEMTTLELGHFNGFPLKYDLAFANRGPIKWFGQTGKQIFDSLRAMGKYGPEDTIVQVNHPRDSILGYFNDISLDPDTTETILPRSGLLQPQGAPFDVANVSYDFDAIEIFNGKRWDLLRTLRAPDPLPPPPYVVDAVRPGDILRYPSGQIAYPGAIEDWFHLLRRGYRYTGTGNSDSHSNSLEEPGSPRTYVGIGVDDPIEIRDLDIARAIKGHRAIVTNGPFVELFVNDQPVGSELKGVAQGQVRVRVQKPSWIVLDRLNIYVNGEVAVSHTLQDVVDQTTEDTLVFSRDAFVVAEVTGQRQSLWPMVTGWEELPLTLQDALRDLAGPLGLDFASLGNLQPTLSRPVYPYAITNPIWIDVEGDGNWARLDNPSPATRGADGGAAAVARETDAALAPAPDDVRALFKLFGGHH